MAKSIQVRRCSYCGDRKYEKYAYKPLAELEASDNKRNLSNQNEEVFGNSLKLKKSPIRNYWAIEFSKVSGNIPPNYLYIFSLSLLITNHLCKMKKKLPKIL